VINPKEVLEWAATKAERDARAARALIGCEEAQGDWPGYATRLEAYARWFRHVLVDVHPAPMEREEWARQIAAREVDLDEIDDIHLLRSSLDVYAEAFVKVLDRERLMRPVAHEKLLDVARCAKDAVDQAEECESDDGRVHMVPGTEFDALADALDRLEEFGEVGL
jgi:hypothetical protein